MTLSGSLLTVLLLLPWGLLWGIGGIWLVRAAFRLPTHEEWIVGFAVGWIVENWLANWLVRLVPTAWAFWGAAGLVFFAGLIAVILCANGTLQFRLGAAVHVLLPQTTVAPQWLLLACISLTFFSISRGMAIFDDFAHLPTVSIMAAGDIPPHFSLDPAVVYGYHYFLLLFQAQTIRIAGLLPWVALDVGRALAFGTAILLAAVYTRRLTHSLLAGFVGGAMMAFGSGTRWLLLFLPRPVLDWLSQNVHMLGSGAASGASLADAMQNFWAVEGVGPIGFPFAFANGIYPAGVINGHSANGLTVFVILLLLLLTFNRWRNGLAGALSVLLISVWGLLGEAELVGVIAGWGLVVLAYLLIYKTWRLPRSLWIWLGVTVLGSLVGFLEGGAWTDLLLKTIERLAGHGAEASYQTIGFQLGAPVVVSSHLGVLPVFDPRTLLVALFELGPVLLVFPLLVVWGIKAFRQSRWYEAAIAATAVVMLLTLFVQFAGSTGVRNTPRLYVFMPILAVFAVPLVWIWAARRSSAVQVLAAGMGIVMMTGGLLMFGIELIAAQRPVYSLLITPLDARMTRTYWDRLAPNALVFDSEPSRATTVLGRHTNSSLTWYANKPEWQALIDAPDPIRLRAAGYRYFYLDKSYWDVLPLRYQQQLSGGCVKQIDEVSDAQGNFRRLLDLDGCQ